MALRACSMNGVSTGPGLMSVTEIGSPSPSNSIRNASVAFFTAPLAAQ
jgi:hypothetical protein